MREEKGGKGNNAVFVCNAHRAAFYGGGGELEGSKVAESKGS